MSWFELDPNSIADRARASGSANVPSLGMSLLRGIVGFTVVSVAGFAPWALFGRWFYRTTGERGLYGVCAIVFIGLSGVLLRRLIIGPGSLPRFYKLFSVAFAAYSVAWIIGWISLRGLPGSLVGLLVGTAVMGWILVHAFDAHGEAIKVIAVLFLLNAIGYFVGGWVEGGVIGGGYARRTIAMLLWGVCYGIGLGAGLGLAFYYCQTNARDLLASKTSSLRANPG